MDIKDFFIDPEGKNAEQIRKIGYEIVDLIVDTFSRLKDQPIFNYVPPKELDHIFSNSIPEKKLTWNQLLDELKEKVLKYSFYFGHPRYIGHMITQPSAPCIFLDALISALNQSLFLWEVGPSAAHLERETIRWLCKLFGYKQGSGGMFLAGGSIANLTALLIARNRAISEGKDISKFQVFCSEYSHFSVIKAVNFAGLSRANLIQVSSDKNGKMDPDLLESKIKESIDKNKLPLFVVATAGTTISGAIDPISDISYVCRKYGVWLHVDAAHGGAVVFSKKYRSLLNGIKKADSIAFDPHKWLYNSIPSATILLKREEDLNHLLFKAPYVEDPENEEGKRPNQGEAAIQGTRGFDALKLWASMKLIGVDGLGKIVDHCIDLSKYLASLVKEKESLELIAYPEINIVCFRCLDKRGNNDSLNSTVQKMLERQGRAFLSIARFKGKKVLRAVILNYCTKKEDIEFIIQEVLSLAKQIQQKGRLL